MMGDLGSDMRGRYGLGRAFELRTTTTQRRRGKKKNTGYAMRPRECRAAWYTTSRTLECMPRGAPAVLPASWRHTHERVSCNATACIACNGCACGVPGGRQHPHELVKGLEGLPKASCVTALYNAYE